MWSPDIKRLKHVVVVVIYERRELFSVSGRRLHNICLHYFGEDLVGSNMVTKPAISQCRGVIALNLKQEVSLLILFNWRPITLLVVKLN